MRKVIFTLLVVITAFAVQVNGQEVDTNNVSQEVESAQDEYQPLAQVTSKNGKYSLSVSGNFNLRMGYDFGGVPEHLDFVTALIPVGGDNIDNRQFFLDATTSVIEINGSVKTEKLGDIGLCVKTDFRGGKTNSYNPRVKIAYMTIGGFTIGRAISTFCDLGSAAPCIDFEGPSVCPYVYNTQLRYTHTFCDDKLTVGGAIEHNNGGEYASLGSSNTYTYLNQYIPSIPAYLQFNWGKQSHVRLTGVYKNIPLYETATEKNVNLHGWGAQLSGAIGAGDFLNFYYSATFGEGICDYMQDTSYGSNVYDVVVKNDSALLTPMYGWQAAVSGQATSRTLISAGYSIVRILGDSSRYTDADYRQGDYLFANVFYTLNSHIQFATEFLWGARTNVNNERGTANRINALVQYNF